MITHARSSSLWLVGMVCLTILGSGLPWASAAPAGDPLPVEKMLPGDAVFALVVRDAKATADRWRTTALFEVLQDPEMKAMFAPLQETLADLQGKARAMSPVPLDTLDELLTGQAGLAVVVVMGQRGPQPVIQWVAQPKDFAAAEKALNALLDAVVESGMLVQAAQEGPTRTLRAGDRGPVLMVTADGGLILLTLGEPEAAVFHTQALARRGGGEGGLADDVEYQAVRKVVDGDAEGWVYLGAFPWLRKNAFMMGPVVPMLNSAGMGGVRGAILSVRIEDRGFRTRAFVALKPDPARTLPVPLSLGDLKEVPGDCRAFRLGRIDLPAWHDRIMRLTALIPGAGPIPSQVLGEFETRIGMNLRNDVLTRFGDRYLLWVSEAGSPGGDGTAFFIRVKEGAQASAALKAVLDGLVAMIGDSIGPDAPAFLERQTVPRDGYEQLYVRSILPAIITPNFTVSPRWMGISLSARSGLPAMRHLLDHRKSVLDRSDFTRTLMKMPAGYAGVSYNDVGENFPNLLSAVQLVTDLGVLGLKIAAVEGELPFPIDAAGAWGMDPARFPDPAMLRSKLFGAVSVTVHREDGILYENFSPVGPVPVPPREIGIGAMSNPAVPAILAGMLLPALARARGEARMASSKANLSQIGKALFAYTMNNNEMSPASLADLFPLYVDNPRVLVAPWDEGPFALKNGMACSYRYVGKLNTAGLRSDTIMAYEHRPNRGGRNALHLDGHVRFYDEGAFREKLAAQYEEMKKRMQKPGFPGDSERIKAFYEDRDFQEE